MDAQQAYSNFLRYKNDPWAFLTECVYTMDQVSKDEPIRKFPDKEYLHCFVKLWKSYPLIANPKARRMTMSWTTIGLFVWDAIFHKARHIAFVSKKEDDANELVKRALFIVEHLDKTALLGDFVPKYTYKYNNLEFPEIMSKIQGFPQGADQLRAFTFSGIFGDESAFWEYAEKFYSASFPTLDGGGRMTLVSSPAPGFFKKLCFDAMGIPGDINVAEYAPEAEAPMQGVRVWLNKRNRFLVFELHYTADEAKRSPEYKESIKNSMPYQEYMREYELHWDTFEGQPVYPEFGKIHVLDKQPKPSAGLPMMIGIDFGLTPAAVIGQFDDGVLTIFKEYVEINMGAVRFMEKITSDLRLLYPTHSDFKNQWKCFVDPAGFQRNDNDERQTAMTVAKYFNPAPGAVSWEARRLGVVEFLLKLEKGDAAFKLYSKECPMLHKGFEGGYRFAEKAVDIEPNKLRPIKDAYSHPHDALQYLCGGVKALRAALRAAVPTPKYATSKGALDGSRIR